MPDNLFQSMQNARPIGRRSIELEREEEMDTDREHCLECVYSGSNKSADGFRLIKTVAPSISRLYRIASDIEGKEK